jgi:hypothetical protein
MPGRGQDDAAGNSLRAVWLGPNLDAARPSSMPPKGLSFADRITLSDAYRDASRRLGRRGRIALMVAGVVAFGVLALALFSSDPNPDTALIAEPSAAPPGAAGLEATSDAQRAARSDPSALTPQDLPLENEHPAEETVAPKPPQRQKAGAARPPSKKQKKARRDFGF